MQYLILQTNFNILSCSLYQKFIEVWLLGIVWLNLKCTCMYLFLVYYYKRSTFWTVLTFCKETNSRYSCCLIMGTAKCYILCIRLQHLQPSLHLCEPRNLLEQKTHRLLIEHCYETITRMIFSAERVEIFAPESTRVNNNLRLLQRCNSGGAPITSCTKAPSKTLPTDLGRNRLFKWLCREDYQSSNVSQSKQSTNYGLWLNVSHRRLENQNKIMTNITRHCAHRSVCYGLSW